MDMLGTPRLPVASEDDIEKAGLEIFKAKSMQEYEQSGKMASISMENVRVVYSLCMRAITLIRGTP